MKLKLMKMRLGGISVSLQTFKQVFVLFFYAELTVCIPTIADSDTVIVSETVMDAFWSCLVVVC